jgi:uncharacterized membrane protein YhaH (DUF805 family)
MKFLCTIGNEFKMMFCAPRLNRARFISYIGFGYTVLLILATLYYLFTSNNDESNIQQVLRVPMLLTIIAHFWWLARRINDTGSSAKWLLKNIIVIIVSVIVLISSQFFSGLAQKVLYITGIIISCAGLVFFGFYNLIMVFKIGTPSDNQYGAHPPENNFFTFIFCVLYLAIPGFNTLSQL